jgi:hypothetical protein
MSIVVASLGTGATILSALHYLGDIPFPWEFRRKEYSIEKRIENIEKAKREIHIVISKNELDVLLSFESFSKSLNSVKNRGVKINTYYPNSEGDVHFMITDDKNVFVEEPHIGETPLHFRSFSSKRVARDYKDLIQNYCQD